MSISPLLDRAAQRIVLPEPPSLNRMIDLAKRRTRRSRTGGWMRRSLPVVYDQEKERYEIECRAAARKQRLRPPAEPWPLWEIAAVTFRVHTPRDHLELLAGLKWPVDWLVTAGYVAGDSPREFPAAPPTPVQIVDRRNRCVELTIRPL